MIGAMGAAIRDYGKLETEYVTGEMALDDLSQKHEIPLGTLTRIAASNGWTSKREHYRLEANSVSRQEAERLDIDVRRSVLQAFAEAQRAWLAGGDSSKRRDYANIARLAAAMTGEVTERSAVSDAREDLGALSEGDRLMLEQVSERLALARLGRAAPVLIEAETHGGPVASGEADALPDFGDDGSGEAGAGARQHGDADSAAHSTDNEQNK